MWVDISVRGLNIRVFAAYAPTNCPDTPGNLAARTTFWRNLTKISADMPAKTQALYLGDFNSTTDLVQPKNPTYFGRNREYNVDFTCNENGEQLTTFCAEQGLGLLNSYFYHRKDQLITHISNTNHDAANKTLDYALSSQMLARYCQDCRVKRDWLKDSYRSCKQKPCRVSSRT